MTLEGPFPNSNTNSAELTTPKNLESVYQLSSNQKTQTHARFNWKILSRLVSTKDTEAQRVWCGRGKEDAEGLGSNRAEQDVALGMRQTAQAEPFLHPQAEILLEGGCSGDQWMV